MSKNSSDPAAPPRGLSLQDGAGGGLYVRPVGLLHGESARRALDADAANGSTLPLAGRSASEPVIAFDRVELIWRADNSSAPVERRNISLATLREALADMAPDAAQRIEALLASLSTARAPFAGLTMDQPAIMGVVNVTPDSFSDGDDHADPESAIAHGRTLAETGAAILDIGGESTRPGAEPVTADQERARVLPVIEGLRAAGIDTPISIDSRRASVMDPALRTGADIVNDITALTGEPASLQVARDRAVPVILMHMLGEPRTMQNEPRYHAASLDVFDYLEGRVRACEAAGIPRAHIAVDPGIGFGKTIRHNLEILAHLTMFQGLGCPVLLGVSGRVSSAD